MGSGCSELASLDSALEAAKRELALGAALSRQCSPGADATAGLRPALVLLRAATRLAQQQGSEGAAADLQRVSDLAARAVAVLSLRRRGSAEAACSAGAAAWLQAPPAASDEAAADTAPVAAALVLLRAELRLLHAASQASGAAADVESNVLLPLSSLLVYGRPGGAAAAAAAADVRLLAGGAAQDVLQLLLVEALPLAGEHNAAAAATLWRVLFAAALQQGASFGCFGIVTLALQMRTAAMIMWGAQKFCLRNVSLGRVKVTAMDTWNYNSRLV